MNFDMQICANGKLRKLSSQNVKEAQNLLLTVLHCPLLFNPSLSEYELLCERGMVFQSYETAVDCTRG